MLINIPRSLRWLYGRGLIPHPSIATNNVWRRLGYSASENGWNHFDWVANAPIGQPKPTWELLVFGHKHWFIETGMAAVSARNWMTPLMPVLMCLHWHLWHLCPMAAPTMSAVA